MIKFIAKGPGGPLVGLGLSAHNVRILQQGKPISVTLKDLGLDSDIEIFLFYGTTEAEMVEDLRDFIGVETQIHAEPGLNPEHVKKEE